MPTETKEPRQEQITDPLAIFDEALAIVTEEVKEIEVKPIRQNKQEKERILEATTERADI